MKRRTSDHQPAGLPTLERLIDRIERADSLDRVGTRVHTVASRLLPSGRAQDMLSGTPLGHPLHPALVAVPIGAWAGAAVLDAGGNSGGARTLVGLGVVAALPAAATGATDWLSTDGAERRVGLVHALINDAAIALYGSSWLARRRGHRRLGVALSATGGVGVAMAGWLGGHLAYAQGVGVDTTAFQQLPTRWTDCGAEADVPQDGATVRMSAAGVPVLVVRRRGEIRALLDRCTHRGASLSEGEIRDDCIECPWHGSRFSLDDGSVRSGPATRPQAVLEARRVDGRIQVRRSEPRSLRTNPVGI